MVISVQKLRWISHRCDGAPGDFIGEGPVNSFIQSAGLPMNISIIEVLRRPVDSAQYTSVRFRGTLPLSGLVALAGTVGDAFDNAVAERTIGLHKTEAVRDDSPFRRGPLHRLADVELVTAEWVNWYNTNRLMHRLGRIPPVDYEVVYYATNTAQSEAAHQEPVCAKPWAVQWW